MAEEYCWAITGGGALMLWPIGFHCVGVLIATGQIFAIGIQLTICAPISDFRQTFRDITIA
jgi:hypothetical protein